MEDNFKPIVQPQRRLNPKVQDVVKAEIVKLLDAGLIYAIFDSLWVSPIHVVHKKGGMTVIANENNELVPTRTITQWRVCIDYHKLNESTKKDHFPLPFIDQMLERLSGNEYYCFLDGFSGYFQIPLALEDQDKTTFTCPYGTFAYRRMPFGLCNAPATFQRCMTTIFHDMVKEGMVLGHKISNSGIKVDWEKDAKFIFSNKCIQAFNILKDKLTMALVIIAPHWNLDFELMCDASDYAVGAILGQRIDKKFHPIYYASKTMNESQENYTTTEKELLAMVYAFDKFQSYLIMSKKVVYTDHSVLKYLFSKQDAKPRLIRLENLELEKLNEEAIRDSFADEHLMAIFVREPKTDPCIVIWGRPEDIMVPTLLPGRYLNLDSTGQLSLKMPQDMFVNAMLAKGPGIDFMGPFPPSQNNKYILVPVDYVSKWVEAEALPTNDARVVVKFLRKKTLIRRIQDIVIKYLKDIERGSYSKKLPIRRIDLNQYGVSTKFRTLFMMDDSNITVEEYIKLQAEKGQRCGQTFNWETATYGKTYCDDLDFFTIFEVDFPAIVYNDALTSNENVSSELTIWHHYHLGLRGICGLDTRLTGEMRQAFTVRMRMVYTGDEGQELFTSHAWRRLFEIRGSLVWEFMLEFFSTCRMSDIELRLDEVDTLCFQLGGARHRMTWREFIMALGLHSAEEMAEDVFEAYWLGSMRAIPDKGDLRDYYTAISSERDFLGVAPSYTYIRDPVRRLCHRHAEGRKNGASLSGGYFIGRLAAHFGLVSDEGLVGLTVIARKPLMIDMDKLVKLNIYVRLDDTWAWVASRPKRQPVAAAGALEVAKGAPDVEEGA
ncbi:reverse transcriptase domain-containing protein [Tanacetum coccineum]|uniref:Reverse transcriptase domain-containing protein n=1 Tax=Tanacetum coccineum TaxID=301880 RepID=A0ABQ5D2X7_9ASTR